MHVAVFLYAVVWDGTVWPVCMAAHGPSMQVRDRERGSLHGMLHQIRYAYPGLGTYPYRADPVSVFREIKPRVPGTKKQVMCIQACKPNNQQHCCSVGNAGLRQATTLPACVHATCTAILKRRQQTEFMNMVSAFHTRKYRA